ncbi:hypothetical protein ACP70R_042567 [Stipagrostis hirtigluma subsp. patula]
MAQMGVVAMLTEAFHGTNPQLLLSAVLTLLLLLGFAAAAGARQSKRHQPRHCHRLPPSPPKLPVIGHLHLVGPSPHISLRDLADRHAGADGLMLLRLGQVPNLVVSSPRAAEAVLRTHDHVFASRPRSVVANILLWSSSDVALAPYGEYWRQARKLVTAHMLSGRKVHALRRAREEEVRLALARVREAAAAGAAVDVSELLSTFANDVVCRAVTGRLSRAGGRNGLFRELIDGNVAVLGGFHLDGYFPSLAKVGLLQRVLCAKAKRLRKRWDELLDEIIDEHADADHGKNGRPEDDGDFVDVLLSLQQEYGLTRDQTKGILADMFAAGTDTSYIVLEYCMVELIRNPHLMTKLQANVTKNTPKDQEMVKEDNINNMTYLKAVVRETLRLHPPAPLLLPRLSMTKCDVNGYMIPAETRVIINAWALGRDTRAWEKADEFIPDRFIDNGSSTVPDLKGGDFKFLPFGAGRRICPGMNFGMATVEVMLANLVYCFDWELPTGMNNENLDMTDVFGLTMRRKDKLLLIPKFPNANT